MKKNRIITWTLLLALPAFFTVAGCKKFLDRKPLTATLEDLNQGALEGRILRLYSDLRGYAGFSLLPWMDFHSIRDDDTQKGSDANDGAEVVTEFDTYQYTKDDWAPNTYWNDHYAMINNANDAVAYADSLKLSDAVSKRNIGEACFFIAYSYFELVKTYGDVPLFKKPIRSPQDGLRDKSPASAIYAFIDSNLQVAAAYLPLTSNAYGGSYPGRLTSGAAKTLWAQTYLFRQNWAQVVALCNQVIASGQYDLMSDFSDIWRDAGENGKESIFEMQAYVGPGAASNSALDYGSDFGTSQQVRRNGAPLEWNLGWGWGTPTDKLVTDWPSDDPRKDKTILYSGQSDGGPSKGGFGATLPAYSNPSGTGGLAQKYWNKKLYTGNDPAIRASTGYINNNGAARWINHRIFRYADVLLMLAEASNELNDGATAAANLEKIRNRASGNLGPSRAIVVPIPFTSQAQMRTAIKNERRWELALEGFRFYDLVRWGDAVSVLGPLGYTNRARFYPIPQKAIDLSGGVLKQNPEW
ncbi:MAG: RagB/SusD family nutrient uptake outer membrane protein [Flavisolibacter sp.]